MSNTPRTDEARAALLRRIDGVISDLRAAISELQGHTGVHAEREITAIRRTISDYEALRKRVNGFR